MVKAQIASTSRLVMPIATSASANRNPEAFRLVDISLQTIFGNVSSERASAWQLTGGPVKRHGDLLHVRAVADGVERYRIDAYCSPIRDGLRIYTVGVIVVREKRRDEARIGNLIPPIKPDRFNLLQH